MWLCRSSLGDYVVEISRMPLLIIHRRHYLMADLPVLAFFCSPILWSFLGLGCSVCVVDLSICHGWAPHSHYLNFDELQVYAMMQNVSFCMCKKRFFEERWDLHVICGYKGKHLECSWEGLGKWPEKVLPEAPWLLITSGLIPSFTHMNAVMSLYIFTNKEIFLKYLSTLTCWQLTSRLAQWYIVRTS